MLVVNDRVKTTEESGFYSEGLIGTIVKVDENDKMMPYKVKLDGEVFGVWMFENEIELLKEEEE